MGALVEIRVNISPLNFEFKLKGMGTVGSGIEAAIAELLIAKTLPYIYGFKDGII